MPELPEVEITRQGLAQRILGARVLTALLGKPLRWPLGCEPDALKGRTVGEATRRAKYLWLPLSAPKQRRPAAGGDWGRRVEPNLLESGGGLLIHLGMSGSLSFSESVGAPGPHDHFDLVTTQGTLRLNDPRRFGAVVWSASVDTGRAAELLAGLGVEPFDPAFDGAYLKAALSRRKVAVKQALLAGDIVVGAGNIYACEALHAAGIDPRARSDRISRARCGRLARAVQETLGQALMLGGSTLRNFRDTHGVAGRFQAHARVYGREGEPCMRCAAPVRRIVQGQRATFFCAGCQLR